MGRSHSRRWIVRLGPLGIMAAVLGPARVRGDIEEQRVRLPPAAGCPDFVEGLWMSHAYYPHAGAWYLEHLRVRRTAPGARTLVGDTRAEYWLAGPTRSAVPVRCEPGLQHRKISALATGSIEGAHFIWRNHTLGPEEVICWEPASAYELVTISGDIDSVRNEFVSVLSGGPTWSGIEMVFRRVACADGSAAPGPVPVPPVLLPPGPLQPPSGLGPPLPVLPVPPPSRPPGLARGGCCAPF